MPDYQNGKIYMLGLPPFLPYYGSTTYTLETRMRKHKNSARQRQNGTLLSPCSCSDLVLRPGCKIELVEDFPCSSEKELLKREGWYQLNNPCINKNIAGRTQSEWYFDNLEHRKQYLQSNSKKIKNDRKQKIVCEMCGSTITKWQRARHKKTKKCMSAQNCV
jgi:hypothetical protein